MQEKWLSMVNKEKIERYMRDALSTNEMPMRLPDFFWTDWVEAKNSNSKFRELFKDSLKIKQKLILIYHFLKELMNQNTKKWKIFLMK